MSFSIRLSAIAVALVLMACGSSTAPAAAGIHFLSGSNQTDTIQAVLPQPLVIQLTAPTSGAFQTVTFTAIDSEALVAANAVSTPASSISQTTDANGKAGITVILGKHAGRAGVVVTAPTLKYSLTANFTVKAGAVAAMQVLPSDTTIYVGESVPLRLTLVDRFNNALAGGTFQVTDSGPATISGTTATGTAIGRVLLSVKSGTFATGVDISVVPAGRVAVTLPDSNILLMNLDGSQQQILHTPRFVEDLVWAPSGNLLAVTIGVPPNTPPPGGATWALRAITTTGTITAVDSALWVADKVTSFSTDGTWIYYNRDSSVAYAYVGGSLWRVHPDGTGNSPYPFTDTSSAPHRGQISPDGKYLILSTALIPGILSVLNTSTGVTTGVTNVNTDPFGVVTQGAWSPTGDLIAYVSKDHLEEAVGSVHIVAPDGTGDHTLAQGASYFTGPLSWSPDGNWLIVGTEFGGTDLVGVTTSADLPLFFTNVSPFVTVVWQP